MAEGAGRTLVPCTNNAPQAAEGGVRSFPAVKLHYKLRLPITAPLRRWGSCI